MEQAFIQIGNSIGAVIPVVLRKQNGIESGGKYKVKQVKEGILITPLKKDLASNVDVKFVKMVDEFITEHEDVLKELAKR